MHNAINGACCCPHVSAGDTTVLAVGFGGDISKGGDVNA